MSLISIKPTISYQTICPYTGIEIKAKRIFWAGLYICAVSDLPEEKGEIIDDLKAGHGLYSSCQVDLKRSLVFGKKFSKEWLGFPLLYGLQNPEKEKIEITKEILRESQKVIILNCIDHLYGHSLLKLLNSSRHLKDNSDYGLIVIVQKNLRWLVPDGIAEIWTVNIPLKKGRCYYPSFDQFVQHELERFTEVYISEAYSHPAKFDVSEFTKIAKYDFTKTSLKITFVWREDRLWCSSLLERFLRKINLAYIGLILQNWKVKSLLKRIRLAIPEAEIVVVGLGQKTKFPDWIQDLRVNQYNDKSERQVCQTYSESILIIGVHGSNMLLPSGHGGITIDLMPNDRWGNLAQDILYQELDPRLASFRYRYIPISTSISIIADIAVRAINDFPSFYRKMLNLD